MDSYKVFKEKLDSEHKWPTDYMFKFVSPKNKAQEVRKLFYQESLSEKKSKAGNYISFTFTKLIYTSDEVVDIYIKARSIEGLISL